MRSLLTLLLLACLLAGCSAAPGPAGGVMPVGGAAPAGIIPPAQPTGALTPVSVIEPPPVIAAATAALADTSAPQPALKTVGPPKIPIGSGPGASAASTAGWQTFASPALGVAIDYPQAWSVSEASGAVTFTSPEGLAILLQAEKNPDTTGWDCATLINMRGQAGETCYQAATFSYRAVFSKPADASSAALTLSVTSRERPAVFFQMFDSFRFTP